MEVIDLYLSDKKVRQFNRSGWCEVMHNKAIYRINKKPENLRIARRIAKLQEKIRILKQQTTECESH